MATTKLGPRKLKEVRELEAQLQVAMETSDADGAIQIATQLQTVFGANRKHHRLLRTKLFAFEACLDANRVSYAERGFIGIRQLSNPTTRIYLEASSLLAICLLRDKKIPESKKLLEEVISKINNIASDRSRHQFQQKLVQRIEEECILTELIGTSTAQLDLNEIETETATIFKTLSNEKILRLIGNQIPAAGINLLNEVRDFSLKQLPPPDRRLLPPPESMVDPEVIGRTTFALMRRIAWKTFCKPSSPIYKLWAGRIPKVFNEGYFSAAVVSTFADFKIGLPLLASGIAALVMKYSAEEFCSMAKPIGLMIDRKNKDA